MSILLTLPLPPPLTNSGKGRSRHWRVLNREKKDYWSRLTTLQMMRKIPTPAAPFQRAEITATLYLWNPMDDGNAFARLKWVEDWLVKRGGFLTNDSRKHLRYTGIPGQVIDRANPRVEIEIREAA